jgi:hypothetical protein
MASPRVFTPPPFHLDAVGVAWNTVDQSEEELDVGCLQTPLGELGLSLLGVTHEPLPLLLCRRRGESTRQGRDKEASRANVPVHLDWQESAFCSNWCRRTPATTKGTRAGATKGRERPLSLLRVHRGMAWATRIALSQEPPLPTRATVDSGMSQDRLSVAAAVGSPCEGRSNRRSCQ